MSYLKCQNFFIKVYVSILKILTFLWSELLSKAFDFLLPSIVNDNEQ